MNESNVIYSLDEIKERVRPIADSRRLAAVYVFGSYTNGDATPDSDLDILVDITGSLVETLFDLGGLFNDFRRVFSKEIDLITTSGLRDAPHIGDFSKVKIYENAR